MERLHAEKSQRRTCYTGRLYLKIEKVLAIMDSARQIGITQAAIASEEP